MSAENHLNTHAPKPTEAGPDAPGPETTALATRTVRRFTAVQFLMALVLWIVSAPLLLHVRDGDLIEAVLAVLVFASAVVAVGGRRRTLVIAVVLVAPAFVGKCVNHFRPELVSLDIVRVAAMVFLTFVMVQFLRFILRAPQVDSEVLCAAISAYLLLAILWAFAYLLADRWVPGSFAIPVGGGEPRAMAPFEAIYFSFVTLSTVGYGDVVPTSDVSRMLAISEATVGMFYVTVLVARLVSLYTPGRSRGGQ